LKRLNEIFNEDAQILIARRFANQNGLTGKAIYATDDNITAAGNQPAIEEVCSIQEVVEDEPDHSLGEQGVDSIT